MTSRRMAIRVTLTVDPTEMAAEYGEPTYPLHEVREKLSNDVAEHIRALPYASALSDVEVTVR